MLNLSPKVGVGVIVIHNDKILLGKRKNSHGNGDWAPPGGHLEMNETVEECAVRELAEETGLKALTWHRGPWVHNIFSETKQYVTLFICVTQWEGSVELLEPHKCEGWHWFEWDNLPSPIFSPLASLNELFSFERLLTPDLEDKIHSLQSNLNMFFQERNWDQFHSPKNLVMDLASEIGELVDPFRWLTEEQSYQLDDKSLEEVKDEIGDVLNTLIHLSQKLGIDPIEAAENKLKKTALKYPKEACYGKSLKYTAYQDDNS